MRLSGPWTALVVNPATEEDVADDPDGRLPQQMLAPVDTGWYGDGDCPPQPGRRFQMQPRHVGQRLRRQVEHLFPSKPGHKSLPISTYTQVDHKIRRVIYREARLP